jgi:exodeoxyribonuclease-5
MNTTFSESLFSQLKNILPFEPTAGQSEAMARISNFIARSTTGDTYLLKGYAGTGKTTIISALVKVLPSFRVRTVLMAPTGRAAKVMSGYSGKMAFTIHRKIYRPKASDGAWYSYNLAPNQHVNTLFIVDEASMISDNEKSEQFGGGRNMLSDLIDYVRSGSNCRLLLVGDLAQLPPVGQSESPALDIKKLAGKYELRCGHFELKEVVRQAEGSGILLNATQLRKQLSEGDCKIVFNTGFPDVERISGYELGEKLTSAYSQHGAEDVVVVCRSNRAANNYNRQIRFTGMWFDEEINAGDHLMCVKNNYFWLGDDSKSGFIANGDALKVRRIRGFEEQYGFRFAVLELEMVDYPDQPPFEAKVNLDCLYTESPALTREQSAQLYREASLQHADAGSKTAINARVASDPYCQALQIKFGYAVTCHKAQGGQWKEVFVDAGYLTEEMINEEYLRWLYTAVTRAREKLYLVNFPDKFFNL